MSNVVSPRIVLGPDNSLAAKDVYSVTDNEVSGASGTSNVASTNITGDVKVPKAEIKTVAPTTTVTTTTTSDKDAIIASIPEVSVDRLKAELNRMPDAAKEILGTAINNPAKKDELSALQRELASASGLINKRSRSKDITGDVIDGLWGENGKAPDPNCNALSSLFGNGYNDWGANLMLNLMLLAKMIECGFVESVDALLDSVDQPLVKEAMGILGVGAFFKKNSDHILTDRLAKNKVALGINEGNPFEGVLNEPKRTTAARFATKSVSQNSLTNGFKNDPEGTVLTEEELARIKQPDTEGYGELFDSNPVLNKDSQATTSVVRDNGTETGVSLNGLEILTRDVDPTKIKDAYPSICEDIIKYYRLPRKTIPNLSEEYTKLTVLLDRFDPFWRVSIRDNSEVSCLKLFSAASKDALYVLSCATNSNFVGEALVSKTYYKNDVRKLLNGQYAALSL